MPSSALLTTNKVNHKNNSLPRTSRVAWAYTHRRQRLGSVPSARLCSVMYVVFSAAPRRWLYSPAAVRVHDGPLSFQEQTDRWNQAISVCDWVTSLLQGLRASELNKCCIKKGFGGTTPHRHHKLPSAGKEYTRQYYNLMMAASLYLGILK